jgi:NADP-dependent 3-hydroxy acid dehydrogenase YdfG
VTGASDGMGLHIALHLAEAGAKVAMVSRREEPLREAMAKVGKNARMYVCDIRDDARRRETIATIVKDFGQIDILVNNAGIWHKPSPFLEIDDETIDAVLDTNLTATIRLTKLVLPYLQKRPEAAIINIVSQIGKMAKGNRTVYAASKWGLRGFSDSLRDELQDSSVHVAAVYPAGTKTGLFTKAHDERSTEGYTDPACIGELVTYMLTRPQHMWIPEVSIDTF